MEAVNFIPGFVYIRSPRRRRGRCDLRTQVRGSGMTGTVTVFGGSGFIGRYVVQRLARDGWTIRVAVRHPGRAKFLRPRSEEHTSELQSLMRISYAVFCLKK